MAVKYAKFDEVHVGDRLRRRRRVFRVTHKLSHSESGSYLELSGSDGPTVWNARDFDRRKFYLIDRKS